MLSGTQPRSIHRRLVVDQLNFPTSIAFDDDGRTYIAESGLRFDGTKSTGRILRLESNGSLVSVKDGLRAPVVGLTFHNDALFISEGGCPGRISRLSVDGDWSVVLDNLPGGGNYHTNQVAFDRDDWMFFGQGALTNSGIVGPDSLDVSWLKRLDHPHDIPGVDITVTGFNSRTTRIGDHPEAQTGPFSPFGQVATEGQRIVGSLPCTAAVMKCRPDGSELELVAWGLRNPYGLCFLDDGRLIAADLGMNDRGSRPIGSGPDCLFVVESDRWYGWPDYVAGQSVTNSKFTPARGEPPQDLLMDHTNLPALKKPEVIFDLHAAPVRLATSSFADSSTNSKWGDSLYVALFGDKLPLTGPHGPRAGRSVVRIDPNTWIIEQFAGGQFHRPIDIAISPHDDGLYVLDFGQFEMKTINSADATLGSGQLWRLSAT